MTDRELIFKILAKNSIAADSEIKRFSTGIANRVYGAGDYAIKIEGDSEYYRSVLGHQKDITAKLLSVGAKVPKILDAGEIEGKPYILMNKLEGSDVVYDWMNFAMEEKESFMAQISEELKKFHSIASPYYSITISSGKKFSNLKDAVDEDLDIKSLASERLKPEYQAEVDFLKRFYEKNSYLLEETGTAVLVHNDLHLENIFYRQDKITGIIDLDWVSYAPKDYELWKIVEVVREPKRTVEEKLEPLYENYKMTAELGFLKKYYPELFSSPHLADRIRLFYMQKVFHRISDYRKGRWSEDVMLETKKEIAEIYKTGWLDELLNN